MKHLIALIFAAMTSAALAQTPPALAPMTLLAKSSEVRFQMVFHVNDAALAKLLPQGWVESIATQGAAKDVNLRLIFLDAATTTGPDGKPLGKGRDTAVLFAVPVQKADGSSPGQMILDGVSQNYGAGDDPGLAFGALEPARTASMTQDIAVTKDSKTVTEDWDLAGSGGTHVTLHVKFTALPANHTSNNANFYNPADPNSVRIVRAEQANDILRNVNTTPADRVLETRFKFSGGKLASLFDGSEKIISWDSLLFYNRMIGTPAP